MSGVKLNKHEISGLRSADFPNGRAVKQTTKFAHRLASIGFVTLTPAKYGCVRMTITPAGRAWLAANKEKQDE